MCGEFQVANNTVTGSDGSSPHVWGIPLYRDPVTAAFRFIPTCVGNSSEVPFSVEIVQVHPHMCGEFLFHSGPPGIRFGSSPHVWGIRSYKDLDYITCRFIPTCVGNSNTTDTKEIIAAVHPHMCGEFFTGHPTFFCYFGSSPHVWGIHTCAGDLHAGYRFIPTCVGNSSASFVAPNLRPVHPHMCGEF